MSLLSPAAWSNLKKKRYLLFFFTLHHLISFPFSTVRIPSIILSLSYVDSMLPRSTVFRTFELSLPKRFWLHLGSDFGQTSQPLFLPSSFISDSRMSHHRGKYARNAKRDTFDIGLERVSRWRCVAWIPYPTRSSKFPFGCSSPRSVHMRFLLHMWTWPGFGCTMHFHRMLCRITETSNHTRFRHPGTLV